MDDILLSDSNAGTLERMFEEVKFCPNRDYKLLPKKHKKEIMLVTKALKVM